MNSYPGKDSGYNEEEWDYLPFEVQESITENLYSNTDLQPNEPEDCCVPYIGPVALNKSIEIEESIVLRRIKLNDAANSLRPHKQSRELTPSEEARIDRLTDQGSFYDAVHKVTGKTPEEFFGSDLFDFDTNLDIVEDIVSAKYSKDLAKQIRIIGRLVAKINPETKKPFIEQKELKELLRLIEYKRNNLE